MPVVLDEVIIAPPYAPSDVKGNKAERVERVKKIVRSCRIPTVFFALLTTMTTTRLKERDSARAGD